VKNIEGKKVYVVLLTWRRLSSLKMTMKSLINQTYKDYSIHITNANLSKEGQIDSYARYYTENHDMDISVSHDGNDIFAFRRFTVGRTLVEDHGADIVIFIDDDVSIPADYIENCLKQYEPKTYKSGFAWTFQNNGQDYYKYRTRVYNNDSKIHYGGTGVSMIDASIFIEPGLMEAPIEAYRVEDLWLSYYVDQIMNWKIKHMTIEGAVIGGADGVALYKEILEAKYTKSDLLRDLVSEYHWDLSD
jgi:hypothetical protein